LSAFAASPVDWMLKCRAFLATSGTEVQIWMACPSASTALAGLSSGTRILQNIGLHIDHIEIKLRQRLPSILDASTAEESDAKATQPYIDEVFVPCAGGPPAKLLTLHPIYRRLEVFRLSLHRSA
jgi:hypothetical protein